MDLVDDLPCPGSQDRGGDPEEDRQVGETEHGLSTPPRKEQ